jgi:hypothetical protein
VTAFIVGCVVSLLGIFAAYITGRSSKTAKEAQSRADTIERATNADTGNPDGSGDLEFLRSRGKRQRDDNGS